MLKRMGARRRRVLLLRIVEGCSYADIAERLDLSVEIVESELAAAFATCANWDDCGARSRAPRAGALKSGRS
jgi:DNA-directed RNA polymerase specialized sigma24 family protein